MSEKRKKYDREFREGAVRIVRETGKSIAQVARDLGIHEGTLGNWVARDREAREGRGELTRDDLEELKRLRSGFPLKSWRLHLSCVRLDGSDSLVLVRSQQRRR